MRHRRRIGRPDSHGAAWHAAMMGDGPPVAMMNIGGRPLTWDQVSTFSKREMLNPALPPAPDAADLYRELLAECRKWGWL